MPPPPDKSFGPLSSGPTTRGQMQRDIIWDRPVFRPPSLPNPRVIFDPLPFTAHRLNASPRQGLGH